MEDIKKVVLKLDVHDENSKRKAMVQVSKLKGIHSIAVDVKEGKMTVIGEVDPSDVARILKKEFKALIITAGPPPKKDALKKDDKKTDQVPINPYSYSCIPLPVSYPFY